MMNKLVAVVGLAGSGKTEVCNFLSFEGFHSVSFGDVTREELKKTGLPFNESNERAVREELRKKHGMDAYAKLTVEKIDRLLKNSSVVLDNLSSWEEYKFFKNKYGDGLVVVAVFIPKKLRYSRLSSRPVRPLREEEASSRDASEIENMSKAGPIVVADHLITNDGTLEDLKAKVHKLFEII